MSQQQSKENKDKEKIDLDDKNKTDQNQQQKEKQKHFFEINQNELNDQVQFKTIAINLIEQTIKSEYGENYQQNEKAQKYRKRLKQFIIEVLNAFKNNVLVTSDIGSEEDNIKQEKIIYTEPNHQLKLKTEKRKKDLLEIINLYENKKDAIQQQYINKLLKTLQNNFKEPQNQQQNIQDFTIKIPSQEHSPSLEKQEQEQSIQKNNEDIDTYIQQNMTQFMREYVQDQQLTYKKQMFELQQQDQVIQQQNEKIFHNMNELTQEVETLQLVKDLGLF